MTEEIPLTLEPVEKKGGLPRSWLAVALVIGIVIGVAVGYLVNIGTLQSAYQLVAQAQVPPPDYGALFLSPNQAIVTTALATPLRGFPVNLPGGSYNVLAQEQNIVYVHDARRNAIMTLDMSLNVLSVVFPYGKIVGAAAGAGYVFVATVDPNMLVVYKGKELDEVNSIELRSRPTAIGFIDEPEPALYVAFEDGTLVLYEPMTLTPLETYEVGPVDTMFVGVKYIFLARGNVVRSFYRPTMEPISEFAVEGSIMQLQACRGLMFVLHEAGIDVLRIPTLDHVRSLDIKALKLRNEPFCTAVYAIHNAKVTYIAVPSLKTVDKELPMAADDVIFMVGGGGVVVEAGRKVVLACGG